MAAPSFAKLLIKNEFVIFISGKWIIDKAPPTYAELF
jgi:hypothetical protein